MKKHSIVLFAAVLLTAVILCSCSQTNENTDNDTAYEDITVEADTGDDCEFLTQGNWEGSDTQCVNVITFHKNGSFSNWCYCGSPVGDGDLSETFRYRASDRAILLFDGSDEIIETGKVLYADEMYLIVDLWGRAYVYENLNAFRPTVRTFALEYTGTEEQTKPCLSILAYSDGKLTVSAYNYDKDAAGSFEVWQLDASEDITFTTVSVTVRGENETIETAQLTKSDYENIGEFYHSGYVEINRDGEITSVVFYGELIISE